MCRNQIHLIQIVTDSDYSGCGNLRCSGSFFRFKFLLLGFFGSLICRLLDDLIIKLMENKDQKNHYNDGTDQTDTRIDLLFQIKWDVFVFFYNKFLCVFAKTVYI